MANGFNATNLANLLKTRYTRDFVETMVFKDKPLMAMLKKNESMGGKQWDVPVMFEDPMSRSADFSQAQTLSTSSYSRSKTFSVTRVEDFGVVTVKGQDIEASKGNENAFFAFLTTAIDGIMRATARSASIGLYRKGWGAIGTVGSISTTTLTLANKQDIVNFAVGQVLVGSSSEDGAVLRSSGASATITGIDRNAGTLTSGSNWTAQIAALAASDYLFVKGDRQDSATPTRLKIAGIEDWCPQTAPTSTSFFGVDRTSDTRLGGCRHDGSGQPIEEAIIDAGVLVQREGGSPDICLVNPHQFGKLVKSLGSKVNYVDVTAGTTAGIGFKALQLFTPSGAVKIVSDRDCPVDRAFLLQLDTWTLGSLGSVPRILNHDGLQSLRQASDDGIEIRVGYYGNMYCNAPGWNCNIKLAV